MWIDNDSSSKKSIVNETKVDYIYEEDPTGGIHEANSMLWGGKMKIKLKI